MKSQKDSLIEASFSPLNRLKVDYQGVTLINVRTLKEAIDELINGPYDLDAVVDDLLDHDGVNRNPDGHNTYELDSSVTKSGKPELISYERVTKPIDEGNYQIIIAF